MATTSPSLVLSTVKSRIKMLNVDQAAQASTSDISSSPVKSRIKMLNVDQASQVSPNSVSRFASVPSVTKKSMYDIPPRSPSTPKVSMYLSLASPPGTPEKSVRESPPSTLSSPVKPVCETPLQSAATRPINASSTKISRSITARDLETLEVIKKEPSKEERIEAATKIQALARGRQGRMKSHYFSLLKQLDEAERRKEQEIRGIREELERKKRYIFERAHTRSMRKHDKGNKVDENKAIVQSLRDDNRKMRTQTSKLKSKCEVLHAENCQLEKAVAVREDYFSKLKIHQEGALQTHERLLKADPMYKAAVNELEESLEIRKEYADAETRTKMSYRKFMLSAAERLEKGNDENLKYFVSSSIIGLLDGDTESNSASIFNNSEDTVNRAVAA
jgi:hypothetical protein